LTYKSKYTRVIERRISHEWIMRPFWRTRVTWKNGKKPRESRKWHPRRLPDVKKHRSVNDTIN